MCSRSVTFISKKYLLVNRLGFSNIHARCFSDGDSKPKQTPLYNLHQKYGGKVVDFAGFLLPVQYPDLSVSASHLFTRKSASIFDVSHMLQTNVYGKDCVSWFESICPVDLKGMAHGTSSLTVFLNKDGGIIDDLIVTKVKEDQLYIVSNAGRLEVDTQHMLETSELYRKKGKDVKVSMWDVTQRALIAVQGPKAAAAVQAITNLLLEELTFMTSRIGLVAGVECRVTRCGYTGEDGVEISIPEDKAVQVTEALLQCKDVKLAGLGARDSLRLEAGLCLYGNDIDETVTPVEAALTWLISKNRRQSADFPGAEIILRQIKDGVSKRRVGIRMVEGAPARKDALLKDATGNVIGKVTSGCPSPSLGGNVAMGYVKEEFKKVGNELLVNIRGKDVACNVAKMPFVPSKYYIKK